LLEPDARAMWEIEQGAKKIGIRDGKTSGRKPQGRFTKKTGKLARAGKGDW